MRIQFQPQVKYSPLTSPKTLNSYVGIAWVTFYANRNISTNATDCILPVADNLTPLKITAAAATPVLAKDADTDECPVGEPHDTSCSDYSPCVTYCYIVLPLSFPPWIYNWFTSPQHLILNTQSCNNTKAPCGTPACIIPDPHFPFL